MLKKYEDSFEFALSISLKKEIELRANYLNISMAEYVRRCILLEQKNRHLKTLKNTIETTTNEIEDIQKGLERKNVS